MSPRLPTLRYSPDQLTWDWQAASILMDYPEEELLSRLALLDEVASGLPAKLGSGLQETIGHLRRRSPHPRRCHPHRRRRSPRSRRSRRPRPRRDLPRRRPRTPRRERPTAPPPGLRHPRDR